MQGPLWILTLVIFTFSQVFVNAAAFNAEGSVKDPAKTIHTNALVAKDNSNLFLAQSPKKKRPARKPAPKKPTAKKPVLKRPVHKRPSPVFKKPIPRKPLLKKPVPKRAPVKRPLPLPKRPNPRTPVHIPSVPQHYQSWTPAKIEVLIDAIGRKIEQDAFSIGTNFRNATARIKAQKGRYINAKDRDDFIKKINPILEETFGITHLFTMRAEYGRGAERDPMPFPPDEPGRAFGKRQPARLDWTTASNGQRIPILVLPSFSSGDYNTTSIDTMLRNTYLAGYRSIIIDLTNNGGGAILNLKQFCCYFLPNDQIIGHLIDGIDFRSYSATHGENKNYRQIARFFSSNSRYTGLKANSSAIKFTGKVAVLVDGGSASCSEIFAQALKEHHVQAKIFGSPTARAVLAAQYHELPGGDVTLEYPVSDYVSTEGVRLEGNGVSINASDFAINRYDALAKAVHYILQ